MVASGVVDETSGHRCQVAVGPLLLATDDWHDSRRYRRPSVFRMHKQNVVVVVDIRNNSDGNSRLLLVRSHRNVIIKKHAKIVTLQWNAPCTVFGIEIPNRRVPNSVAVLAEISLRSPHKLFIFIIKNIICWVKVSKNKII